jgi:hypothetical protein
MSFELRPYRPGDESAILETHNLVFGEGQADFQPRSPDEWRWTYTGNPGGTRIWLALDGPRVAAHYGAQPFRVLCDGRERTFSHVIDSMVHPDYRRGLKREGLFATLSRRFVDETVGPGKDVLIFGWPIPSAWRMSKTFIGLRIVRRQLLLAAEPGSGGTELPAGVEVLPRFDAGVRALYETCAAHWGASVIRDRAWLDWRFVDKPRAAYRILAVRSAGTLAGYAVFRASDWPVPRTGIVADWLVPRDSQEVADLLRRALMAEGRRTGCERLLAMFPEWDQTFDWFQGYGWRVVPTNYPSAVVSRQAPYDTHWLRDHWWYSFAEMDLV